jgi:hypothetical protein
MGVEKAVNVDDLYRMAKRRTPKVAFRRCRARRPLSAMLPAGQID